MKKNTAVLGGGLILISVLLSGCGNQIPEYSEEDTNSIMQYAADILLESKDSNTRLIDTAAEKSRRDAIAQKAAEVQAKIDAQKAATEKAKQEAQANLDATPVIDNTDTDSENNNTNATIEELASFLELENVSLSYAGAELTQTYVDASEEDTDWVPEIDATTGYQLLVINIEVTNTSNQVVTADVLSQNVDFRLSLNGEYGGATLMTMLLSDFSLLKDSIEAEQTIKYVLIVQVPESVTEINQVTLTAQKESESITVSLQ